MTVSTASSLMSVGNATGGATFPYTNHRVPTNADIEVYYVKSGDDGILLTLDTHYTVAGAGAAGGVTVTYPAAGSPAPYDVTLPTPGYTLDIKLAPAYEQTLDLTNQGAFSDSDIEQDGLDDLALQLKSLEETISRCIQVPIGTSSDPDSVAVSELENREILLDEVIVASPAATVELFTAASTDWPTYYDRLRIEINGMTVSAGGSDLTMWPMDSGVKSSESAANMPSASHGAYAGSTAFAASVSGFKLSGSTPTVTDLLDSTIYVSKHSGVRFGYTATTGYEYSSAAALVVSAGYLDADATSLDGFHFAMSATNIATGTFRLWGLPKT